MLIFIAERSIYYAYMFLEVVIPEKKQVIKISVNDTLVHELRTCGSHPRIKYLPL